MSSVHTVILNWNGWRDTVPCLESLKRQTLRLPGPVVVENGSTDDSAERLRPYEPWITLLQTGQNLGYAGGNNFGLRWCLRQPDCDYVFVLNNDTVLHPACVEELVRDLESHPEAAAAAPKSFFADPPDRIFFAGGRIDEWQRTIHVGQNEADSPEFGGGECEWLCGCAMLIRRSVLDAIGLFDERYFLLFEEADWCLRARQAGYSLRCAAAARLWHKCSASFGPHRQPRWRYYYLRNQLLWLTRHFHGRALLRGLRGIWNDRAWYGKRLLWLAVRDFALRRFGQREYPVFRTGFGAT